MASKTRVGALTIPAHLSANTTRTPRSLLPARSGQIGAGEPLKFESVPVTSLFEVKSGDFHSTDELDPGDIPLISCGDQDNGIIGFYSPPLANIYRDRLTIAYNGDWPLMAKYHPYDFAAKDDVAVLVPREEMAIESLLFVQLLFNRDTWRHSYGRKLYKNRLEKYELTVPVDGDGKFNHAGAATWFKRNPMWTSIADDLATGLPAVRQGTLELMMDSGG